MAQSKEEKAAYLKAWHKKNPNYNKEWCKANQEHLRAYRKEYGQKPEQLAYKSAYWLKNKEELSAKYKEYATTEEGRENIRACGYRKFDKDREAVHKRNKVYRQTHMDKVLFWINKRKVSKLKVPGSHTLEEWLEIRNKTNGICPCCKKNVGLDKLTRDHIVPLVWENTSDNIDNIQPLCRSCNSSKQDYHSTKYI